VRVTDRLVFQQATSDMAAARARAEEAQHVASTGLRVQQPGDDPAAAGVLAGAPLAQGRYTAIGAAAGLASDELQSADGALNTVSTALSRARELAVQFANSTYSASQRAGGATELDGLLRTIVGALNVKVGDRYVFGGTKDDAPPFDVSGNYAGNGAVRQVEIAPGVLQDASVRADVALKGAGGGVDVLATLGKLRDALTANDPAAVQGTLDDLDTSIEQVSTARAQAGVSMNALDTAVTASRAAADDVATRASKLSDADVVESATDLAYAQTALQASMAATAQGFKLSLVDYLR
jgi:flagellar hook-associated protein 3 FlgL